MDELIAFWGKYQVILGVLFSGAAAVVVWLLFRKLFAPQNSSSPQPSKVARGDVGNNAQGNTKSTASVGDGFSQRDQKDSVQYNADLAETEAEIHQLLENAMLNDGDEVNHEAELADVEKLRLEEKTGYEAHIEDLEARVRRLDQLSGQLHETLIIDAQQALIKDDKNEAGLLFEQVKERASTHIEAAAESDYQLGKLAGDEFRYQDAYQHFQRAAQLVPENTFYLNEAGVMAFTLGQYTNAIEYYELALAGDLETYGEDHLDVATRRNNLGLAFDSLGQYKKAIEYFELALPVFKVLHGEGHASTKMLERNLELLKADLLADK